MITTVVLSSVMAAAVAGLLRAIRVGDRTLEVISKTTASAAFVMLGLARWSPGNPVGAWLIAGLVLCAVGDLCLLSDRSFDLGLISFLLGHLAYVAGFHAALPIADWPLVILAPLALAGVGALAWLWPNLGRRRIPVVAYIVAITAMVWGGMSVSWAGALGWTAATGAILFYLSDLAVARHRFVRPSFVNRALGLPLYYVGQLLLALTIGAR
jgi:uncharacterized membrane protein YhhN